MLRDRNSGSCNDKGCCRTDVECAYAPAPGATGIDRNQACREFHRVHHLPHGLDDSDQDLRTLSAHPEAHQEGAQLVGVTFSRHDRAEGLLNGGAPRRHPRGELLKHDTYRGRVRRERGVHGEAKNRAAGRFVNTGNGLRGLPSPATSAIIVGFMGRAFLLTLQFDGTDFCGWQRQPEGQSVQGEVERVLSRLADRPIAAVAAGRTDAGVHALALPVSTLMPDRWEANSLLRALNGLLPSTIAVSQVQAVLPETDARRHALGRRYRYTVGTGPGARSPFRQRTEWPLGRSPQLALLQGAAQRILGEHDFRAFAAVGQPKPHYRCHLREASWIASGPDQVQFTVSADRFLHHMVRFLVGTMVDIGIARRNPDDMARLLERTDNSETSPPAPAPGLTFLSAIYPPEIFLEDAAAW